MNMDCVGVRRSFRDLECDSYSEINYYDNQKYITKFFFRFQVKALLTIGPVIISQLGLTFVLLHKAIEGLVSIIHIFITYLLMSKINSIWIVIEYYDMNK